MTLTCQEAAQSASLHGLGPVGAHAHTPQEYLDVASLVPRAQALALSILRLPAQFA